MNSLDRPRLVVFLVSNYFFHYAQIVPVLSTDFQLKLETISVEI